MLGFSFTKILVLGILLAVVWYGFKYIGRLQRIEKGTRKPAERSMGERLRKATRAKSGSQNSNVIEDTEKCPTCGVYLAVDANSSCGKNRCPY